MELPNIHVKMYSFIVLKNGQTSTARICAYFIGLHTSYSENLPHLIFPYERAITNNFLNRVRIYVKIIALNSGIAIKFKKFGQFFVL